MAICLSTDATKMYTATTEVNKSIMKWKTKEIDDLTLAIAQNTVMKIVRHLLLQSFVVMSC